MEKYFAELDQNHDAVNELIHHIQRTKVVFLFGSKEIYNNNAVALKKYIEAILAKENRVINCSSCKVVFAINQQWSLTKRKY